MSVVIANKAFSILHVRNWTLEYLTIEHSSEQLEVPLCLPSQGTQPKIEKALLYTLNNVEFLKFLYSYNRYAHLM